MQGGQYTKDTRIDGKVVIITGANSGIGKETAIDLAKRGGKVYIACRNQQRGEDALKEINREWKRQRIFPTTWLVVTRIDSSVLEEISWNGNSASYPDQ